MKKLSILLFALLMVFVLGTVTSCNDETYEGVEDTLLETGGDGQDPKDNNNPPAGIRD